MKRLKHIDMKKPILTIIVAGIALALHAGPSVLDIKHSITDNNVVAPESFETKTRQLRENYYLKHFTVEAPTDGTGNVGNATEYEDLLSRLPAEIEMPYNQIVGKFIDMYLGKRRDLVSDMLALHNYYGRIFVEELVKQKVPLELQYLPVIESAINPNAVSRAGAVGLWQFMPATALDLGLEVNSLVDQRRDPRLASHYAVKYLKQLYGIYGDWSLAIAAYNCGPGNVNKALRRAGGGKKDFWEIYNYLLPETRGYFPAFIAANYVMNYHNRYGIKPTLVKNALITDTVQVSQRINFQQIADVLQIPVEEIRMLNPQFRKDIIPGDNHPYALVLPSQQVLSYIISEPQILANNADEYGRRTYVEPGTPLEPTDNSNTNQLSANSQTKNADGNVSVDNAISTEPVKKMHVVGRGENLRDIAKKYGVSATDVKRWNNLRRGKVKEGDRLEIQVIEHQVAKASTVPTTESTVTERVDTRASVNEENRSTASRSERTSRAKETTSAKAAAAKTTIYSVRSGDSLDKIAKKFGVSINDIRSANGMSQGTTRINIGQKLKIPAAKSVSSAKKSTKSKSKTTNSSSKKKKSSRRR
ncbi:MAG: transglycosylase SLT domain-containing protein [Paramuribaculum sp.]|nr:transglycosylase SLT domain-containing protein [Paramuribaculum sp.]